MVEFCGDAIPPNQISSRSLTFVGKARMENTQDSIFREYYNEHTFVDRFETDRSAAVDVIIPVIHTNELWKANLFSLYREIPIHKLFIGDGGCVDNSIDVVKTFP